MKSRRKFTPEFKGKVAISALKEQMSTAELAKKYDLHPGQVATWKKEFLAKTVSPRKGTLKKKKRSSTPKIGQLQIEVDFFFKKVLS